eukprot:TRINITY_DN8300_c0_g1_i1.p1 TRINITY_DN8300_c0_g1~~TRINITY_DN8300_c0_g1_i1.p1  ORF type:complete len:294 (+),score=59.25 TRINITY_DN8300_c0_g1_i1:76-957(+)
MDYSVLQLPSGPSALVARLHPVVLFNICDSYIRRNEPPEPVKGSGSRSQDRVIGTLLGTISSDGIVEIKNSYAVPHNESMEQVAIDIEYHKTMFDLHQRVNPKEVIVGWYSTGATVTSSDALIQDFYGREVNNPIHMTVDTGFTDDKMTIKAYVSSTLGFGDRSLAAEFYDIQLDMKMVEAERVGFDVLKKTIVDKLPDDLEGLEDSMRRLQGMVETVFRYVDDVVEGRTAPDNTVGRYLADTVASIPRIGAEAFDKLFNDSVQDLLLVLYLASLTRTQLALAEKLNTPAQAA